MPARKRRNDEGNPNDPHVWKDVMREHIGMPFHWSGDLSTHAAPAMVVLKEGEPFGVIVPTLASGDEYVAALVIGGGLPTIEAAMLLMQEMTRQVATLASIPAAMLPQGEDDTLN